MRKMASSFHGARTGVRRIAKKVLVGSHQQSSKGTLASLQYICSHSEPVLGQIIPQETSGSCRESYPGPCRSPNHINV